MRARAFHAVVTAAAVTLMAVILFAAGYVVGRVRGGELDRAIAATLRDFGLEQYSQVLLPRATDADDLPLSPEDRERFKIFWEAWGLVEREFLDRTALDHQKMIYGAVRGMLAALNDPYTVFLDPAHRQISDSELRGSFDGIGVQVDLREGRLTIVSPLEGSPGERAGLRPGDVIVEVNGESVADRSLMDVVLLIRGPRGTSVRLTVQREGAPEPLYFEIVREEIKLESVRWQMLGDQVAYVRVASFSDSTPEEVRTALQEALEQQPRALVLDLRNNPGGYLHSAIEVASEFLSSGVVLYQEQADGSRQTYQVKPGGIATELPMAVLVNKGSASAAEIVAGAIQAHGRAPLIGEQTYGKGTVQNIHQLADNSSIRITFARWLTPSEQPINGHGLTPDVVVASAPSDGEDRLLQAALDWLAARHRANG